MPPATGYANIFYGIHEIDFLPEFKDNLKVCCCFVDDNFGIWTPHPDSAVDSKRWNFSKALVNDVYSLKWISVELCNEVNYMDLTILLANGKITTKVYKKNIALYQYIPPSSAHPSRLNASLVIGQVLHYHQLSCLK